VHYTIKDVEEHSKQNLFSVVSTFAGAGGSSVGYKLSGGNVVLANEVSKSAVKIYKRNHTKTNMINDDIRNLKIDIDDIDILDGSPPCVTFSVARAKKRDYTQEESITENLVLDYISLAQVKQPKICIIENVRQFKSAPIFEQTLKELRSSGYIVNYKVLNSADYRVPQIRLRLFIVAIRKDISSKLGISENDILNIFPKKETDIQVTVKEALKGLSINQEERDLLLSSMRKSSNYEILKFIPKNPPKKTRMSDLNKDWTSDFSLDRASWERPSPTLTSLGQQIGRGGICHPQEDRVFTINELCRLTGLPDDYSFSGTFNEKVLAIGNMVPPFMISALSKNIYQKVIKPFCYGKIMV